jgi:O-antigen/teichoic acid export membrane protein
LGSLASVTTCVVVASAVIDDPRKLLLVLIFTLGVLFHAPRIANLWFQYKVQSSYTVFAKSIPSVISGVGVLIAAFMQAPVEVFAVIVVSDTILGGLALTVLCAKAEGIPTNLRFSFQKAKDLLSQSWPLIASAVAVKVYLRVDQLMLERMVNDTAVGVYSVAAEISEIWYVLPTAIGTSALSGIVGIYAHSVDDYRERLQDLFDLLVLMAFGVVLLVCLVSGPLINTVYGTDYSEAVGILRVLILAAPFVFMGAINSKAIITEGFFRFSFIRHSAGAVVNVLLNIWLIPRYGGLGAAWATVFSYAMAHYLSTALYRPTHPMLRQMTRALFFPFR